MQTHSRTVQVTYTCVVLSKCKTNYLKAVSQTTCLCRDSNHVPSRHRLVTVPTELPMLAVCGVRLLLCVPAVPHDGRSSVFHTSLSAGNPHEPRTNSPLAACFSFSRRDRYLQYINARVCLFWRLYNTGFG